MVLTLACGNGDGDNVTGPFPRHLRTTLRRRFAGAPRRDQRRRQPLAL